MTKRTAHALALVFSATPLLLMGCGSGGTGGTRVDAGDAGGAAGAVLDVHAPDITPPAVDTVPVVDVAVPVDTTPSVDLVHPDALIVFDVPIAIDLASIDVPAPVDVTFPVDLALPDASMVLDVLTAMDLAPVEVGAPVDVAVPVDATALIDTATAGATDEILWSCDLPTKSHCFDYGGRNNQLSVPDQQSACVTNGGIWSASPCPTANRLATCLMYGGNNPNSGIVTWWRWLAGSSSLSVGQQLCLLNGNTWIPG